jgi:hypothetical protein
MMNNFQGKTMGFFQYHETKTYNSATSGLPFLKPHNVWSKIGPKHRFRLFVKSSSSFTYTHFRIRTPAPVEETTTQAAGKGAPPTAPLIDADSANGKAAAEEVKKAVCEICNFFHSFLDTLVKPSN